MIGHMLDAIREQPAARLREIEDREIADLDWHVVGPNDQGWATIACDGCEEIETLKGSSRQLAEKVQGMCWMIYDGQVLCVSCQAK